MKSLISLKTGKTTYEILRAELKRIEKETGYSPEDWMYQMYDEAYEEYHTAEGFDWEGFEMHMCCLADSFIEFIRDHYQNLNMNM